jgi:hypothetical protein
MTLVFKNILKLFEPYHTNLDSKLWVQKVILKKYIKKLKKPNKF